VVWITIWSPSPDADGKFLVSNDTAACESVFGRLKFELKSPPIAWLNPSVTIRASSHPATTLLRCWTHQRANPIMDETSRGVRRTGTFGPVLGTEAERRADLFWANDERGSLTVDLGPDGTADPAAKNGQTLRGRVALPDGG
jgi:hypothetical protein